MICSRTHLPSSKAFISFLISLPHEAIFSGSKQTPTSSFFVGLGFGAKTPAMQN
jgi:hypothetical protein